MRASFSEERMQQLGYFSTFIEKELRTEDVNAFNAQVTHSWITSPVLLRIKLTDDSGYVNFRSRIRMHFIQMIKSNYV